MTSTLLKHVFKLVAATGFLQGLMAGIALLLKIIRQFERLYEKKQFYSIKNGQVGWMLLYADQHISK